MDDASWSGRTAEVDSYQVKILIENSQCYTTQEIANTLKRAKASTENHLCQVGYGFGFDV